MERKRTKAGGLRVTGGNSYLELEVGPHRFLVTLCGAYVSTKPTCNWRWALHRDGEVIVLGEAKTWAGAQRAAFRAAERQALAQRKRPSKRPSPEA